MNVIGFSVYWKAIDDPRIHMFVWNEYLLRVRRTKHYRTTGDTTVYLIHQTIPPTQALPSGEAAPIFQEPLAAPKHSSPVPRRPLTGTALISWEACLSLVPIHAKGCTEDGRQFIQFIVGQLPV